jgi:murein L,D-transpeptidase YcbB/YkuD
MKTIQIFIFLFFTLILKSYCKAQEAHAGTETLQQFVNDHIRLADVSFSKDVKSFYNYFNYNYAWLVSHNTSGINTLVAFFDSSADLGLNAKNYQYKFITDLRKGVAPLKTARDSIVADIRITDAAIHFFSDVVYGNTRPLLLYNGLNYTPACYNISLLLANYLKNNNLNALLEEVEPSFVEYAAFKNKIVLFNERITEPTFKEVKITSQKVNENNKPFFLKLYQLGVLDSVSQSLPAAELKTKIKEIQRLFSLMDDGVMRSTVMDEMNVPLATRIKQLNLAINYVRWLHCAVKNKSTIILNIPSASLNVYEYSKSVLESKVIVGKASTRTPTLSSTIQNVVLYPYWQVPHKIAVKELLPIIKRNVGYLDEGNYDVLDRQGRRLNPYNIDWHSLSTSYFPYTLRQSTGCDNSLGIVKFDFDSPFSVYLHDTPLKGLFDMNKRYYSHGCMRIEKAIEIARIILKDNTVAIDTLTAKGCLLNQSPVVVPADVPMQLFVIYSTSWYYEGEVKFFEDAYDKLNS